MISYLFNNKSPLFWLIFHVILGAISTFTPLPLIFWFYLVLSTSVFSILNPGKNSFIPLVFIIAYTTSFELLARMSKTSPYIPYELGKYLIFILLIFGIIKGYRKGKTGWLLIFLLLPGILIDEAGMTTFKNIVFNLVGPVNVALAIVFFSKEVISRDDFVKVLKLLIYPLVSVLAFVIIKTPDLDKIEFSLRANFETAGGFGTNQVSTALGLGAFLAFLFWRKKWSLTGYGWLDLILFIVFAFRGLLTFSRGGMMGGAIGILIILFLSRESVSEGSTLKPVRAVLKILPVILILLITFKYADRITGGQLALRYQGETAGTLKGTKEKTLNTYTSNRVKIFEDDFELWTEYPFLGVGVGASSYLRKSTTGFLSHVEMSRLLSEHGIFGIVFILILCVLGFNIYRYQRFEPLSIIMLALFAIAIFTTFHAAMRTYISPLLIGISTMTTIEEEDFPEENELSDPEEQTEL
jgi:hypothetical protein